MEQTKYYVKMTDKFLSWWGKAEGKINKLVIECDSYEEARIVADNASDRSDMTKIMVVRDKPHFSSKRYYVSYKTKKDYPSWFVKNYFKDNK